MGERINIEEILKRFEAEWVLVVEADWDEHSCVQTGEVAFHSKHRRDVESKAMELKPRKFAIVCAGELPVPLHLVTRL